jgi:hypothetical protein
MGDSLGGGKEGEGWQYYDVNACGVAVDMTLGMEGQLEL